MKYMTLKHFKKVFIFEEIFTASSLMLTRYWANRPLLIAYAQSACIVVVPCSHIQSLPSQDNSNKILFLCFEYNMIKNRIIFFYILKIVYKLRFIIKIHYLNKKSLINNGEIILPRG